MKPNRAPLLDVILELAPSAERPRWHGQGAFPLSVRITDKLVEMLIAANEVHADVTSEQAGPLRAIAPEIELAVARIDAMIKRLAS